MYDDVSASEQPAAQLVFHGKDSSELGCNGTVPTGRGFMPSCLLTDFTHFYEVPYHDNTGKCRRLAAGSASLPSTAAL